MNILAAFSQALSIFVDEGQYLLVSKKMLDGWVPYRDIIENKPIGMYISLIPAVLLCGKDFVKLRLFGVFIVSLTSFLIFLIGERVKDKKAGLLGALVFILIESFPNLYGYNLLTEPIANLFIAALFYMIICAELGYPGALVIGALTAASCSVKQTSLFVFIPLAFVFMHASRKLDRKKLLLSFLIGGGLLLSRCCCTYP